MVPEIKTLQPGPSRSTAMNLDSRFERDWKFERDSRLERDSIRNEITMLDTDEEGRFEEPGSPMKTFVRRNTFTRSLRIARERMSQLSKRLAKSADDLAQIKEEEREDQEDDRSRSKSTGAVRKRSGMAPKFAINKKSEFDYNAALELEYAQYARWSKHCSIEGSTIDLSGISPQEETSLPKISKSLSFSFPISEVISTRKLSPNKGIRTSSSSNSNYQPNSKRRTGQTSDEKRRLETKHHKLMFPKSKAIPGRPSFTPLRSGQFVRETRRTLMLDADPTKCECVVTDKDDGEVQFSCVLSKEGIVCRNHRTMLDIVSIGNLQQLNEDEPLGVYYTIEGKKDGQIAKIKKGRTLSRVKTQINLVTDEDRRMLLSMPSNGPHDSAAKLPILKQSLLVLKQRRNILKIVTKSNKITVASIQKEMSSQRHWLHIEPNVDSCFVSAIAAYILRKRIFGDKLPKVLKTQSSSFTRRARRLSLSFKRRKTKSTFNSPTSSSVRT